MIDPLNLPSRRMLIGGCVAAAIFGDGSPAASAEIGVLVPGYANVRRQRRPYADFEAACASVADAASPHDVEARMMAALGPLPWIFEMGGAGRDPVAVVTRLALMGEPEDDREVTGAWAVVRYLDAADPAAGSVVALVQLGRAVLLPVSAFAISADVIRQASYETLSTGGRHYGSSLRYEPIYEEPALKIRVDDRASGRYREAMDALVKSMVEQLA